MPRHFTSRVRCLTIVALFLALFAILATPAAAQTQIRSGDRRGAENNARPEKSGARPQDGAWVPGSLMSWCGCPRAAGPWPGG